MTEARATAPPGSRVGQEAAGRYRLVRLLGAGGMGEVYEAEHLAVGKRVAIKCLWPSFWSDAEQVQRFEREARVASIVRSPHVVDILDAGKLEDGAPFLAMELLDGSTLGAELAAHGAMSVDRTLTIARQLATGLAAAHGAGIVHRDLKPENVFLVPRDEGELVKILDFGISKFRRDGIDHELTRTGTAIGTPAYMAPEQVEGLRDVDARADVWSLGVILFRMLTGELPFAADSYARLLVRIVSDDPAPRLRAHDPSLPRDLDAIIARCLEKAPAGRFGSMTELLAVLPRPAGPGAATSSAAATTPARAEIAATPKHLADSATRRASPRDAAAAPASPAGGPHHAATQLARPAAPTPAPTREPRPTPPVARATPPISAPRPLISPPAASAGSSGSAAASGAGGTRSLASLPFDEVLLTADGRQQRLAASAFFALPLSTRIQHVIARTVVFLKNGREVDRQEALARMRERFAG